MALGTFTVGRDAQVVVIAPSGIRLELSGLISFNWTPEYKTVRSDPLNRPPIERDLPTGHRLQISIDRNGPENDLLFSNVEQGWWTVGSADPGTSDSGTIFLYINEISGQLSTYQFSGVTLKLSKGGDFATDTAIKQMIEGFAQRYIKVT